MPVTGLLASDWLRAVKRGGYMARRPTYRPPDFQQRGSNPVRCGRKFCATCGHWRLLIDFHVCNRTKSGTPVNWFGSCMTCARVRKREALGRSPKRFGRLSKEERARRDMERHRTRWASDPAYRERRREDWRFAKDKARREAGIAPRNFRARRLNHSVHTGLRIEPFRDWLRDYIERERQETPSDRNNVSGTEHVYEHIGLAIGRDRDAAYRAVYRWMNESQVIPLDYADAVLTRLDSPARLYELWPELDGSDVACA